MYTLIISCTCAYQLYLHVVNSAGFVLFQLDELRQEFSVKESRWSSTLSRYRLRIESLEAQNDELQNDLRVMEEQRLLWWQQQVDCAALTCNTNKQLSISM